MACYHCFPLYYCAVACFNQPPTSNTTHLTPDPHSRFINLVHTDKTPVERAKLLEETTLFGSIHSAAANSGQTDASTANMNTELHFTTFVRAPAPGRRARVCEGEGVSVVEPGNGVGEQDEWRLVELDGMRMGPIDRGECKDLLKVNGLCLLMFLTWLF